MLVNWQVVGGLWNGQIHKSPLAPSLNMFFFQPEQGRLYADRVPNLEKDAPGCKTAFLVSLEGQALLSGIFVLRMFFRLFSPSH